MSQLLGARNLRRDYLLGRGGEVVHAVRGVSLEVARGDYLAIVGPSGSGKSSLLNLLGAIDRPDQGELSIAGERVDCTESAVALVIARPYRAARLVLFPLSERLVPGEVRGARLTCVHEKQTLRRIV